MVNILFALMPLLATQPAAIPEGRLTRIDVVLFMGNPETKDREVLSRPQLITRDRQEALISVGQSVELALSGPGDGTAPVKLEPFQVGYILKVTPTWRADGRVALQSIVTMSEVIDIAADRTQTKESKTRFNAVCTPGEKVTVPLYNTHDYQEVVVQKGADGVARTTVVKKPYTGKECWVEFVVREFDPKKDKVPDYSAPEAVPVETGKGAPRAVPVGR